MRITVPVSAEAPHEARRALEDLLEEGDRKGDLLLATSELVSNAVLHSGLEPGDPITVDIERTKGRIRVRVSHRGPPVSIPPSAGRSSPPGGHGLAIIDQVTARWDVDHREETTSVWFEA